VYRVGGEPCDCLKLENILRQLCAQGRHCTGELWQVLAGLLEVGDLGVADNVENVVEIGRGCVLVTLCCYFP
jgi:hypothetical protein